MQRLHLFTLLEPSESNDSDAFDEAVLDETEGRLDVCDSVLDEFRLLFWLDALEYSSSDTSEEEDVMAMISAVMDFRLSAFFFLSVLKNLCIVIAAATTSPGCIRNS